VNKDFQNGGDALWVYGQVIAGLAESNGSLRAGFMAKSMAASKPLSAPTPNTPVFILLS